MRLSLFCKYTLNTSLNSGFCLSVLLICCMGTTAFAAQYPDVTAKHWAKPIIALSGPEFSNAGGIAPTWQSVLKIHDYQHISGFKLRIPTSLRSRWQLCCLTDAAYPLRVLRSSE